MYFLKTWLLKKIWTKSTHPVPNDSYFKITLPTFYLCYRSIFDRYSQFQRFLQKIKSPYIPTFKDINSIFCTGTQDNDLIQWCDFRKNRTSVAQYWSVGLKDPPRNLSRLNTPGLIGLNPNLPDDFSLFVKDSL